MRICESLLDTSYSIPFNSEKQDCVASVPGDVGGQHNKLSNNGLQKGGSGLVVEYCAEHSFCFAVR